MRHTADPRMERSPSVHPMCISLHMYYNADRIKPEGFTVRHHVIAEAIQIFLDMTCSYSFTAISHNQSPVFLFAVRQQHVSE